MSNKAPELRLKSIETGIEYSKGFPLAKVTFHAGSDNPPEEIIIQMHVSLSHFKNDNDLVPAAKHYTRLRLQELLDQTADWGLGKDWFDAHSVDPDQKK